MRKIIYRSFESARKFAQKLGLKNKVEWQAYCKSGNNPEDIPASARDIYKKDFKGWGDFLGTGNVKPGDRQYRSFEEAREFARSLKLKGGKEWQVHCKSGNNPEDIPSHPDRIYKNKGWTNWGDFLGSGTIASKNMKGEVFWSFKKARKFVRTLKLKDNTAWKEYCKSKDKPDNITSSPNKVYKNDGWIDIPDWLGNGNFSNIRRDYLSYEQCSKLIQKNNIATRDQLTDFRKSCKRPDRIPGHPWNVYKKQGTWISWIDFTGTGKVANQNKVYRSYDDAKKFVKKLNFNLTGEWKKYCKSGNKPDDIPTAPWNTYKKEWTTFGNFTGTGKVANQNKLQYYLPWPEAQREYKKLAKENGFQNQSDWKRFAKKNPKLLEELRLPIDPTTYTRERVWKKMKNEKTV